MTKAHILLTNDDGFQAGGLRSLIERFQPHYHLTVVAPQQEMSGVSHAITIRQPLIEKMYKINGIDVHAVSGTPADCVKLAIARIVKTPVDLVVSGINQGPNTGVNVFYSGTASAAMEAVLLGIPAMAVSLASYSSKEFQSAAEFAYNLAGLVLRQGLPDRVFLNINVPNLASEDIKGYRLTVQGRGIYRDDYAEYKDPAGNRFFWLDGNRIDREPDPDIDDTAVLEGWVSITPIFAGLTAFSAIPSLQHLVADHLFERQR